MSHSKTSPTATPSAETPAAWPRPTLVALPPLRDLTLQSGAVSAGASFLGGVIDFTP